MTVARKVLLSLSASVAFAATSAAAQEICSGLGDNTLWIGGARSSSDVSASGVYLEQMALVLASNQYITGFEVTEETDVRVEAAGRGNGDTIIDLFSADGVLIATDDDSGGEGASRTENRLGVGTYCVALRSYDDSPMTAFVRVSRLEQEALTEGFTESYEDDEPANAGNEVCESGDAATTLTLDQSQSASAAEVNAYRFTLTAPTAITISANNEDADPYITLFDGSGNQIAENDDYIGLNSRIIMNDPLEAGEYCLAVSALSDDTQPIETAIVEYDPIEAVLELVERGEVLPPLDGSYPIEDLGKVQGTAEMDVQLSNVHSWIEFEIAQSGLIAIDVISYDDSVDPILRLFDDAGNEIGYNDDGNDENLNSFLALRIKKGMYYAAVGDYAENGPSTLQFSVEHYTLSKSK